MNTTSIQRDSCKEAAESGRTNSDRKKSRGIHARVRRRRVISIHEELKTATGEHRMV